MSKSPNKGKKGSNGSKQNQGNATASTITAQAVPGVSENWYSVANTFTLGQSVGFTVSTKYFKKAVDRNRIKRLMREAYRLQKNELQKIVVEKNIHLAIFFVYTGNELPDYTTIFDKTAAVLKRVQKNCNEQTKADS